MLIDCHMHTPLCGHASGEPMEYVRAAARKKIGLVTFTCHIPMEWEAFGQRGTRMSRKELPRYLDWIQDTAQQAKPLGVEVLTGIEAEVFPDEYHLQDMDTILRDTPFDFVLGSLHHQCQSYQIWLQENGLVKDHDICEAYFRHLLQGVVTGRYDSIAHPDVIRIYGTVTRFEPGEHEPTIRAFLQALLDHDTCLEVNTSGLSKGVYEVHPDPLILRWAAEMEVPLTLGSDAHLPERVAQHYERVLPLLKSTGFKEIHFFRKRKRASIAL